jgi:hypothetical protein
LGTECHNPCNAAGFCGLEAGISFPPMLVPICLAICACNELNGLWNETPGADEGEGKGGFYAAIVRICAAPPWPLASNRDQVPLYFLPRVPRLLGSLLLKQKIAGSCNILFVDISISDGRIKVRRERTGDT